MKRCVRGANEVINSGGTAEDVCICNQHAQVLHKADKQPVTKPVSTSWTTYQRGGLQTHNSYCKQDAMYVWKYTFISTRFNIVAHQ